MTDDHFSLKESAMKAAPRVQDFLDFREYLRAYFFWRQSQQSDFSYSSWAAELGFRSRSFVRLVLAGRRSMTEKSIPIFVEGLKLKGRDAVYFETLVRFNQSSRLSQRENYFSQLTKNRSLHGKRHEVTDECRFLSSHLCPRLLSLLTLEDLEATPERLARLLGIKTADLNALLEILERLGLAQKSMNEPVTWSSTCVRFEVKDRLGSLPLQIFHRRSLEDATQALEKDINTRYFQSGLLHLTAEEFHKLKADMDQALDNLLDRSKPQDAEGRRLYQINMNAIPVSELILRADLKKRAPDNGSTQYNAEQDRHTLNGGSENEITST